MTKEETLNAIREVLLWVHSGKQDISNGLEEIELINDTYIKELTEEVESYKKRLSIKSNQWDLCIETIEKQRKEIVELKRDLKTSDSAHQTVCIENTKLTKELKRVTKKASIMEGDNFKLIEAYDLLNKNYGKMVDEIEEQRKIIEGYRRVVSWKKDD